MVTMNRAAFMAVLYVLAVNTHTSHAGGGELEPDYSGPDFRDGSCSYKKQNCVTGTTCIQNSEHTRYKCFCPDDLLGNGYIPDVIEGGTGCFDPNEPVVCTSPLDCHSDAVCQKLANSTKEENVCICREGFTGRGQLEENGCEDVNECLDLPCAENAKCTNTPGSYECQCDSSLNYVGDGYTQCYLICFSHDSCHKFARCTNKTCSCNEGFNGDGYDCTDIDECSSDENQCPGNSKCRNTEGSYECVCDSGYFLDENNFCMKSYTTCQEIYLADNDMESGTYTLDIDGTGPLDRVEVDCVVYEGFAVTEIAPLDSLNSPQQTPKKAGQKDVDYPVDPKDLIENSTFCSQEVWLQCTDKFDGGMIQWKDVSGKTYRGWGGNLDGQCACGEMQQCPNGCNCGFGAEGVDDGLIINKDQLPVSSVIFPKSSGTAGTYRVGKLRCGPQTFDLPRDCHEAKFVYGITKDKPIYIDIDGAGPVEPFLVFCNQDEFVHVGIIEIPPENLIIHKTSGSGDDVSYVIPGPNVAEVIKGSVFCSQRVEYECASTSMDEAGFEITTTSRTLNYLPGPVGDVPNTCGCGLTNSCEEKSVTCNCHLGGAQGRKDMALIIDKNDLPVIKVKSTTGGNFMSLGPLQCSQKQFGLEPNCEKYRAAEITDSYSYLIDPDGPSGTLEPFIAECEMTANQGVTVINNDNDGDLDLSTGQSYTINYLQTTPPQVDSLKDRSTGCIQEITFSGCSPRGADIAGIKYNGDKRLSQLLSQVCYGAMCPCGTVTVLDMTNLPIREISGGSVTVKVGPLRCTEIFPDCDSYLRFLRSKGAEGETRLAKDTLTIDPDGPGKDDPFVVSCTYRETVISNPVPEKPFLKIRPDKPNPGIVCWNVSYTDETGTGIGAPQMNALMGVSKRCWQTLTLTCANAMGTGMVTYETCDGKSVDKFVDADIDATCTCGATGTCNGGPDASCNCDTSGSVRVKDENIIVDKNNLPICKVCMQVEDIEGSGAGVPDSRFIRFDVSSLRCGRNPSRRPNCQMYRQEDDFEFLDETIYKDMWFQDSGEPVIIGCKFYPGPPYAEMVIRPDDPVFEPGTPGQPGNITVIYKGFQLNAIKEAVDASTFCTQDILFFCADDLPNITGDYGLFSLGNKLQPSDYELRDLNDEESNELCSDKRFEEQCQKCGNNPKRIVITNLEKVPLTNIILPSTSTATVAVNDATCAYVEKDCETIRQKDKIESDLLFDGTYMIDPDQTGPIKPFQVYCEFNENQGITKVPSDPTWMEGKVGGDGGKDGADFSFTNTYPTATPEQINSLVQNSEFCWQGVKYECKETPLSGSAALLDYQGQTLTSFGTADNSGFMGCACGVLGTCNIEDLACNCDSKGSMVEQGFVTDSNVLPLTGFDVNVAPGGSGSLTVTEVRCAPSPVDIPKNCEEVYKTGSKFGLNFTQSGEYLINPEENLRPFLVYCDFDLVPGTPVTVIKPKPTDEVPVTDEDPEVPYQGPSTPEITAVIQSSRYCYQPVKVDCYAASFIEAGVTFTAVDGKKHKFWSTSGNNKKATCTCGSEKLCGGTESLSKQLATKCNCDIGDAVWRSDAAILDITETGPLKALHTSGVFDSSKGFLNLTVGDIFCSEEPLEFDECALGFNECDERATCIDETEGYRCVCPEGWQGKVSGKGNKDHPMANGRQCIDDDECTLSNLCHSYKSDCVNTPGSYRCECHDGYRATDDFTCVDIDECSENTDNCDVNARCVNTEGSFRCQCLKGYRGTGTVDQCNPVGECSCFGDPHCISFDGRWNHFQGQCTYIMAENECYSEDNTENHFRVSTRNWDREYDGIGQYAWVKEVVVEVYGKIIVLGQGLTITVNGVPKNSYRKLSEDGSTVLIRVAIIGYRVELSTNFGLEVLADGKDEVTVITPASQNNSMCGLCGNYNNNPVDDWTIGPQCKDKAGQLTDNEVQFGNSWTADPVQCPVDCDPPVPPKTCNIPENQATQICDRLFDDNSPFKNGSCLDAMTPIDLEGFRYSCEYDICHTEDPKAAKCEIAEALAGYCSKIMGNGFEWRSDDMCGEVQCGNNEEYKICGPDTEPTCMNQLPVPIDQCQENCYCLPGYMRQGTECVKADDCGCIYEGSFMAIGETVLVHNCTKYVTCLDHDSIHEEDNACTEYEHCIVSAGTMVCEEIVCGENQEYRICGADSEPTCMNQTAVPVVECQKNCYCVEGYMREGEKCVKAEDCGCTYGEDNSFLSIGDSELIENCTKIVTCLDHDDLKKENTSCTEYEECVVSGGTMTCEEILCGENQEYRICGADSEPTCMNQTAVPVVECQKNCYCVDGYMREGEKCVKAEDCGCTYDDSVMAIGDTRLVDNCTKTVTCLDHDDFKEENTSCTEYEECVVSGDNMTCEEIVCGENQEYRICGADSEPTCRNQTAVPVVECQKNCYCVDGYMREGEKCVKAEDCGCTYNNLMISIGDTRLVDNCTMTVTCLDHDDFKEENTSCTEYEECVVSGDTMTCEEIVCGENQEYRICGADSEPTCMNQTAVPVVECQKNCYCVDGYMREGENCVKAENCGCTYDNLMISIGDTRLVDNCTMTVTCLDHDDFKEENTSCTEYEECVVSGDNMTCEEIVCGENQEYRICGADSEPTCMNQTAVPVVECQKNCYCVDGYMREGEKCVKAENCGCTYDNLMISIGDTRLVDNCTKAVTCLDHDDFKEENTSCTEYEECVVSGDTMTCEEIVCGENQEYRICGADSEPTCMNQTAVPVVECQKNCYCVDGYMREGEKCVKAENCGCTYDNLMISIGDTRLVDNCTKTVTCLDHDDFKEENTSCTEYEECVVSGDTMTCQEIVCGENQEYRICGADSEPTCMNQTAVPVVECQKNCYCVDGYMREGEKCVKAEDCGCTYDNLMISIGDTRLVDNCTKTVTCLDHDDFKEENTSCTEYEECVVSGDNMTCEEIVCGENQEYRICGADSEPTCMNQTAVPVVECQKNCYCVDGYMREGKKCVKAEDCGCTYDNLMISIGDTRLVDNCTKTVTCLDHDDFKEENTSCTEYEECVVSGDNMTCEEIVCGENQEYRICGADSEPTCMNQTEVPVSECQKNCYCVEGYMREGEKCVKAEDCGCTYDNLMISIGDTRLVDNCTKTVTCLDHDDFKEENTSCTEYEECVVSGDNMTCEEIVCGENQEYRICGADSEPTCMNQTAVPVVECQKNCYCVDGYMREGENCVKAENCGCTYDNLMISIGDTRLVDNCTMTVTCLDHDDFKEENTSCTEYEECVVSGDTMTCEEIVCGENQEYRICGADSEPTCMNQTAVPVVECQKNCYCVDGYMREGEKCVKAEDCGCTYDDLMISIGDTRLVDNCTKTVTCLDHDDFKKENTTCTEYEECVVSGDNMTCEEIVCGENQEYRICGADSEPTCMNQTAVPVVECQKNCYCVDGYMREGEKCVKAEDCGCTYDGLMISIGDTQLVDNCTKNVTCLDHEDLLEEITSCTEYEECLGSGETMTCEEIVCGENQEYRICGADSEPTCMNQTAVPVVECQKNCYCVDGYMREGEKCVKAEDCGCIYGEDDSLMAIGDTQLVDNCTKIVTCSDHGDIKEEDTSCAEYEECVVSGDTMTCEEIPETTTPKAPELCVKTRRVKGSKGYHYKEAMSPVKTTPVNELTRLTFSVKTCKDAFFLLTDDKDSSKSGNAGNLYEIVLGMDSNTMSAIRKNKEGQNLAVQNDPNHKPLDCKQFVKFWVSWKDGQVQVGVRGFDPSRGRVGDLPAFLTYQDSSPFAVSYLFVSGYRGNVNTWRVDFPCEKQPTIAPPPNVTPEVPDVTPPQPVPCTDGTCSEPNTECQNGVCVCKIGYEADCTKCVDRNECEDGTHNCQDFGMQCVNTEGSYECVCQEGFYMKDGVCHDVDECEDLSSRCGPHSECLNLLGTYECVCCMGYSKMGQPCRRDERLDTVYGAPGQECCACTGGNCGDPQPVCGTDGVTYANHAAMVVKGCRDNRTIEVNYKGYCEYSCNDVTCDKPFEVCARDGPNYAAKCSCPDCSQVDSAPVCASNGKVYVNECIFRLTMCITGRRDIQMEDDFTSCSENATGTPVGPWSEWSECDTPCGRGKKQRTRSSVPGQNSVGYTLVEEVICYVVCDSGPCTNATCHNPGQVCEVQSGVGVCVCPDCTGYSNSPVCAVLGDVVRSFDNECEMRKAACELTKNYQLLENRACEDEPPSCTLHENKPRKVDKDGCHTDGDIDIGFCYGSCGGNPGNCCRPAKPAEGTPKRTVTLDYTCPDGSTKTVEEKLVEGCECISEPQH